MIGESTPVSAQFRCVHAFERTFGGVVVNIEWEAVNLYVT